MAERDDLDVLVDRDALRSYLEATLGEADHFELHRIADGDSNETLTVEWGRRTVVLRRPPVDTTADSAHDVAREYRVMSALQDATVPVPRTIDLCTDESVIGSEFFLVAEVPGAVVRQREPDWLAAPTPRRHLGRTLVETLAEIHEVDYERVGLGDFGSPDGFLRRQLDRWREQFRWALDRTGREADLAALEPVEEWLAANAPATTESTLVHGDYKLNNVVVTATERPEVEAVLDWEMATLGDPLTDLAWLLLFWHDRAGTEPLLPSAMPSFTSREGYPSRADLVEAYAAVRDRSVDDLGFYQALSAYKSAAICEMFNARTQVDHLATPIYPEMAAQVEPLLEYARAVCAGERRW